MKISYDYTVLTNQLNHDIQHDTLRINEYIKIVRDQKTFYEYNPIIYYYYDEYEPSESYTRIKVYDVLDEMYTMQRIT